MHILNIIYIWIVILEHYNNIKDIVTQINIPQNTALCMVTYQNWEHFINFGKLLWYTMIRYEWAERHYVQDTYSWGPNMHPAKHKHVWIK